MEKIDDNLLDMILDLQFAINVDRVKNLIKLYEQLGGSGKGRKPINSTDILRASVVLLHATFEELLRFIAKEKWPYAKEEVLDDIPLIGFSRYGRPEKFLLGKLSKHRGKTVDQVLEESIQHHLNQFNINNTNDLCTFLSGVGISTKPIENLLPSLDDMMSRRHQIVHQADRNPQRGIGHHRTKSLGSWQVRLWIDTIEKFLVAIRNQY